MSETKSQKRARRRRKNKANANRQEQFWGDPDQLPEPPQSVRITKDPAAVLRSIGAPPLSGHETRSEHYFEAVCQRSVVLASALAAAGELIDPEELS